MRSWSPHLISSENTYSYVVSNPIDGIDFYGLTREDIDRMGHFVQATQPDLAVDPHIGTFPMLGDGYRAITNPLTRNTTIDNYYLDDNLTQTDLRNLERLIIHESIHRTRPRWDSISRPFTHDDIYDEAEHRLNNRFPICSPNDYRPI